MLRLLPLLDERTRRVMFTEFPGQTAFMREFGDFPPNAGLLLPDGYHVTVPVYDRRKTTTTFLHDTDYNVPDER